MKPRAITQVSANLRGGATLTATIGATCAGTGREIVCDADYALAQRWATLVGAVDEGTVARFQEELLNAPIVPGGLSGFRCRTGRHSTEAMGPPPHDAASSGRYNMANESVLYLSDSEHGAFRELSAHGCQPPYSIQEYHLPHNELRIADLRSSAVSSFLNHVFWFAEFAGTPEQRVPQRFSHLVAQFVAQSFDGMAVRGVRGDPSFVYNNIVVFRPLDDDERWKRWAVPNASRFIEQL